VIKTEIGNRVIRFTWESEVPCMLDDELIIEYDADVSQTPRHLANFMFGMIMMDGFIWCKKPIIFDELTFKEKDCLEKSILMSHRGRGCCGLLREVEHPLINTDPPKIYSLNIVEEEEGKVGGPVLVSNGFGKDALNSICIARELGFEVRGFTVGRHIPRIETWRERVIATRKFYEEKGVSGNIIDTNFFDIRPYRYEGFRMVNFGFYPYFFGFPLAHAYNSNIILMGVEIHNSKVHAETGVVPCGPESIFTADNVSKATGIKFSSPTRAVTEYGSQKIFSERYPEVRTLQRSCESGLPYCDKCSKCRRTSLNLSAIEHNPRDIGLTPYKEGDLPFLPYHRHKGADLNVERKLFGQPYEDWVEKANTYALDLIWQGKEIKNIILEHMDTYSYDPGLDTGGYTLVPSKWRQWLKDGIINV